jgi:hypothetical protein
MPADWEASRIPETYVFTPPTGGNFELTVGLQGNAPPELTALTEFMTDQWDGLTPLEFVASPITVNGVASVAFRNTSPYICTDIYIPDHGIVRHISFGASFCNEAHDQLNEVGQKVLDSIVIYPPG